MIGIRLDGDAVGFWFPHVVRRGVVNDTVGSVPAAVYTTGDQVIRVYSRRISGEVRSLTVEHGVLVDESTGRRWDATTGGWLGGRDPVDLQKIPWTSAYVRAWSDFHPEGRLVGVE